jgi:transcriptional regulator with XRE-family HTH domain
MSPNRELLVERNKLSLSRSNVAKAIGISSLKLYSYELGYRPLQEVDRLKLETYYGLPEGSLKDELGYPEEIFDEKEKPHKFIDFLNKIFSSKLTLIISSVLLLVCIALIVVGVYELNLSSINIASYYSREVQDTNAFIIENGEESFNPLNPSDILYKYTFEDPSGNTMVISTSLEESEWGYDGCTIDINQDDGTRLSFVYGSMNSDNQYLNVNEYDNEDNKIYTSVATRNDNGITFNRILSVISPLEQTPVEKDSEEWKAYVVKAEENSPKADVIFTNFFSSKLSLQMSLMEFTKLQTAGNYAIRSIYNLGFRLVLFSSLFGALFLATIFTSLLSQKRAKKLELVEAGTSVSVDVIKSKNKPLPKNRRFYPFIPESFIRFATIPVLFCSAIGLYFVVASLLGAIPMSLGDAQQYYKATKSLFVVATILLFYMKLDITMSNKGVLKTILLFLGAGVVFYILEVMTLYDLSRSGNLYLSLISDYFPGNLFWGIGVYYLIAYFLFVTPEAVKSNKRKLVIWRLLALLPILYIIGSNLYTYGVAELGWESLPYYLSSLLISKTFIVSSFAILFILGSYLLNLFTIKRYGVKNGKTYQLSNQYLFMKNGLGCFLILALGLFDLLGKDASFASSFALGKSYYMLALIPFIFFYHPHFGKRNVILDTTYTILYVFSYGISYILIAFLVFSIMA